MQIAAGHCIHHWGAAKIMRPALVCSTLVTCRSIFLADVAVAVLDHDHGAVVEIADALVDSLPS